MLALGLGIALVLTVIFLQRNPHGGPPSHSLAIAQSASPLPAELSDAEAPQPQRANAAVPKQDKGELALLVHIQYPSGKPATASVRLRQPGLATQSGYCHSGVSAFLDLHPGELEIRVTAEGCLDYVETLTLPATPTEQQHVITLVKSAILAVRFIAPDGRRLKDALQDRLPERWVALVIPYLYASRSESLPVLPPTLWSSYASACGSWRPATEVAGASATTDGFLSLREIPPMLLHVMLRDRPIGLVALEVGQDSLEVVVDPSRLLAELGSIRLRLIGVTGEPVPDAWVHMLSGSAGSLVRCEDGSGIYFMPGVPPGSYTLMGGMRNGSSLTRTVLLAPGQHLDLGDLVLKPVNAVTGSVVDEAGQPVSDAQLFLWDEEQDSLISFRTVSSIKSDAEGGISVSTTSGLLTVAVLPADGSPLAATSAHLDLRDGSTPSLALRLSGGVPIRFEPIGEDFMNRRLWILVDGVAPLGGWRVDNLPRTLRLTPGTHAWIITDAAGQVQSRTPIAVRDGDASLVVEVKFE